MERFNLDTWLKDKTRKVIDDDGFPVEIIKWDANEKYPVVLLNHNGIAYNVSVDGMYDSDPNHGIFFADNEPYNPYKVAVESIAEMVEKYEPSYRFDIDSKVCDFFDNVKVKCKDAMEYDKMFPQEEFVSKKQYDEDLEQAYKNADKVQFNRGMDEVLTNPKKYFHVGDTIRLKNFNAPEHTITSIFNGRYYGEGWSLDILKTADDYELVKRYDQKFKIGDTVCRQYYEDHTIVRIYYNCNDPVYVCKNEEGLESHIPFSDQNEWELKSEGEISKKIDYGSEIIGFLKNYIKTYGCTAMISWVNWLENKCNL